MGESTARSQRETPSSEFIATTPAISAAPQAANTLRLVSRSSPAAALKVPAAGSHRELLLESALVRARFASFLLIVSISYSTDWLTCRTLSPLMIANPKLARNPHNQSDYTEELENDLVSDSKYYTRKTLACSCAQQKRAFCAVLEI